jgi:hypothetical protein
MEMKKPPRFNSEDEEREFWAKEDSTRYVDWSRVKRVILPNLKPSVNPDAEDDPGHPDGLP